MKKILVIGSVNIDHVYSLERLPVLGETIKATKAHTFLGGKGANQSIAAAKNGGDVSFMGVLGEDEAAKQVIKNFKDNNVKHPKLIVAEKQNTGSACVFNVDEDNCIVIEEGANGCLNSDYILENKQYIEGFDIIMIQNEVPLEAIETLVSIKQNTQIIIYNPAPYYKIDQDLINKVDYLTPNETEYNQLLKDGLFIDNSKLILTLGSKGAQYENNTIPAPKVEVIDTTGAGDCFNGVFAAMLSKEFEIREALTVAVKSASYSTCVLGAQTGYLTYDELNQK